MQKNWLIFVFFVESIQYSEEFNFKNEALEFVECMNLKLKKPCKYSQNDWDELTGDASSQTDLETKTFKQIIITFTPDCFRQSKKYMVTKLFNNIHIPGNCKNNSLVEDVYDPNSDKKPKLNLQKPVSQHKPKNVSLQPLN